MRASLTMTSGGAKRAKAETKAAGVQGGATPSSSPSSLPVDALEHALGFLDPPEWMGLGATCREWKESTRALLHAIKSWTLGSFLEAGHEFRAVTPRETRWVRLLATQYALETLVLKKIQAAVPWEHQPREHDDEVLAAGTGAPLVLQMLLEEQAERAPYLFFLQMLRDCGGRLKRVVTYDVQRSYRWLAEQEAHTAVLAEWVALVEVRATAARVHQEVVEHAGEGRWSPSSVEWRAIDHCIECGSRAWSIGGDGEETCVLHALVCGGCRAKAGAAAAGPGVAVCPTRLVRPTAVEGQWDRADCGVPLDLNKPCEELPRCHLCHRHDCVDCLFQCAACLQPLCGQCAVGTCERCNGDLCPNAHDSRCGRCDQGEGGLAVPLEPPGAGDWNSDDDVHDAFEELVDEHA